MLMAVVSGHHGRISFLLVLIATSVGTKVSFITLRVAWWNEATNRRGFFKKCFLVELSWGVFFLCHEAEGMRGYPMA